MASVSASIGAAPRRAKRGERALDPELPRRSPALLSFDIGNSSGYGAGPKGGAELYFAVPAGTAFTDLPRRSYGRATPPTCPSASSI